MLKYHHCFLFEHIVALMFSLMALKMVPHISCGYVTETGLHHGNEDTFNIEPNLLSLRNGPGAYRGTAIRDVSLFSVYDGHGGLRCAKVGVVDMSTLDGCFSCTKIHTSTGIVFVECL